MAKRQASTIAPVGNTANPYLIKTVDEESGEEITSSPVKYLQGIPKQYRFNGQSGQFNINGDRPLIGPDGKPVKTFSFQPLAYRVFEENLFNRNRKELWAELIFIDEKNAVSSIMFNSSSCNELLGLLSELHYDDVALTDVVLTISTEAKTKVIDGNSGTWYLARFSYEIADEQETEYLKQYEAWAKPHRLDTMTDTAVYRFAKGSFYEPILMTSLNQPPQLIEHE
jgi:hypothetical protein